MFRKTQSRLTTVGTREVILEGQAVSCIIKRSPRARYVRLEVRPETGLTVVVPRSYKPIQLPDLLQKKRKWILRNLKKYGQLEKSSAEKEAKSADTIPYLGRELPVKNEKNNDEADNVRLECGRLVVSLNSAGTSLNLVLERWFRQQADKLIRERANELCTRLGVTYGRITIRGAKTRWGSCSQKRNLNFNWKLMMTPEPVINYVIIHELAHLREMNHTQKFWKLVAEHCPRWRSHRQWLTDHGAELLAKLFG